MFCQFKFIILSHIHVHLSIKAAMIILQFILYHVEGRMHVPVILCFIFLFHHLLLGILEKCILVLLFSFFNNLYAMYFIYLSI